MRFKFVDIYCGAANSLVFFPVLKLFLCCTQLQFLRRLWNNITNMNDSYDVHICTDIHVDGGGGGWWESGESGSRERGDRQTDRDREGIFPGISFSERTFEGIHESFLLSTW